MDPVVVDCLAPEKSTKTEPPALPATEPHRKPQVLQPKDTAGTSSRDTSNQVTNSLATSNKVTNSKDTSNLATAPHHLPASSPATTMRSPPLISRATRSHTLSSQDTVSLLSSSLLKEGMARAATVSSRDTTEDTGTSTARVARVAVIRERNHGNENTSLCIK
jgi:hypothetical protein